jgi:TonB family protein
MNRKGSPPNFRRAVVFSLSAHVAIFLLLIVNPSLPRPSKKGMIHYLPLNMVSFGGGGGGGGTGGGGGGGGGGAAKVAATKTAAKKETLRDLTVPQKVKTEEPVSSLRYPVDKPKRDAKKTAEKKAVISKPQPNPPTDTQAKETAANEATEGGTGTVGGPGSGLRIGVGGGPGGGTGFGSGYGDQIGLSNFPFTWYLQILTDKISGQWFTSLIDPGVSGQFQVVVTFRVQRNGQVTDLVVEQASGIQSLDDSAKRAVQRAAPFPPLPKDYEDQYLVIHLIFEHSK